MDFDRIWGEKQQIRERESERKENERKNNTGTSVFRLHKHVYLATV